MWLIKDIPKEEFFYRDYLPGVTEDKQRSARLLPWFNVYEEYYEKEHKKFMETQPPFDALKRHEQY